MIRKLGPGCFLAKSDIKSAFRMVPLRLDCYHLIGFKWEQSYYFHKCLPMGLAESCKIFEIVSDAIIYILQEKFHIQNIVKVLDDFLFGEIPKAQCRKTLYTFLAVAEYLGIPIAMDKTTTDPTSYITFLGLGLDTKAMTGTLPEEKLVIYGDQIQAALQHQSVKISELRNITGRLQFSTAVIPSGRPFLRRLIDLVSPKDKPYWHIKLHAGARHDLATWLQFMQSYNGISIIRQPSIVESTGINLYSDASGVGCGGTYGSCWVQASWPKQWEKFNIAILELYLILLLVTMFGPRMVRSEILFHCDSMAIVHIRNKQTSKDKHITALLRPLILLLLQLNIKFRAIHIPTNDNILADAISCFQVTTQLLEAYGMQRTPTDIPQDLMPLNYIKS